MNRKLMTAMAPLLLFCALVFSPYTAHAEGYYQTFYGVHQLQNGIPDSNFQYWANGQGGTITGGTIRYFNPNVTLTIYLNDSYMATQDGDTVTIGLFVWDWGF